MYAKAGQSISFRFPAHNSDGSAEDATSGPVGILVVNGVDTATTATITDVGDGDYRLQGTFPAGLSPTDLCQWRISGTVDGQTPIWFSPIFQIVDVYPWDLEDELADDFAAIPGAVDTELTAEHGSGDWTTGAGGGGGAPGGVECTLTFLDEDSDPIQGLRVWVTADEDGSDLIDGAYYTNTSGKVTFTLVDGDTYYYHTYKAGHKYKTGSFDAEEDA